MPHLNLTSEGKIIELKNQSLGNFSFSSFKVKLLLSQRMKVFLMDQVQEWCEIRHNYMLANEPKLAYSIHIERYISIYTLFDSLISWTRRQGAGIATKAFGWFKSPQLRQTSTNLLPAGVGQDLAGESLVASQGCFCWSAVLDVICYGWLSFAIHMVPFPPFCAFLGL